MSLKRRDFIRLSAGKASLSSALLYGMPAYLASDGLIPGTDPTPGAGSSLLND